MRREGVYVIDLLIDLLILDPITYLIPAAYLPHVLILHILHHTTVPLNRTLPLACILGCGE